MSTRYSGLPDGLPGNDDYGTMSAWYMFAALGFYPQAGSTTYIVCTSPTHNHYLALHLGSLWLPHTCNFAVQLGSPVFPQAVVHLANNTRLVITAHNANADNIYVQKAHSPLTFIFAGELGP
jgi:putative alpha-1,2-mannosidase